MKFLLPRSWFFAFAFLCVLGASVADCSALDREAFCFTNYNLTVQIDPEQHRLGVRGKVTLRNNSSTPQKTAVLQISSSLDWRSIRLGDKVVQFLRQPYTSDIDHTGALSEALVTLPQEVVPHATIELDVAYEGVILLDATRLTRIGTPDDVAKSTDWDQIDTTFTGVRGAGHVAWYPIATEAANLSEGDGLALALSHWKSREAGSRMELEWQNEVLAEDQAPLLVVCSGKGTQAKTPEDKSARCTYDNVADAPSFAMADYAILERPSIHVFHLPAHAAAAQAYANAAEIIAPLIGAWFGHLQMKMQVAEIPVRDAAPSECGAFLFASLADADSRRIGLTTAHQLTHAAFHSSRPWVEEGLAHFAQALYVEHEQGRRAALDYMGSHRSALSEADKASPGPEDERKQSLANTIDERLYRSKATYVWWMLRDLVGDTAMKKAIAAYRAEDDKDPSYMPRLVAAQTQRDLEWFFNDWVYNDRGLPDLKVESSFSSKTTAGGFLSTVTVDNLGAAGAEVPILVKFAGGEVTRRLEVRAKSKAVIRVETPATPQEVLVNDGSVPERNIKNNAFKVDAAKE